MRQCQVETNDAERGGIFFGFAVQHNLRPRAALPHHLDVEPANVPSPAAPQGFHRCFLGREACRVTLVLARTAPLTVFLLSSSKHSVAKTAPCRWLFQGGADALDLSQVIPNGDNHMPSMKLDESLMYKSPLPLRERDRVRGRRAELKP